MSDNKSEEMNLLPKVELFLKNINKYLHPRNSFVYYIKSMVAFERGELKECQELLNRAKFYGIAQQDVRSHDFEMFLAKVEATVIESIESENLTSIEDDMKIEIANQPILVKRCHICEKVFKKTSSLKRHLLSHSGEKNYGKLTT